MSKKAKSKSAKKAKTYKPESKAKVVAAETPAPETNDAAAQPAEDAAPKTRKKAERKDGTMSGLDAAAKVLTDAGEPLDSKTIVERAIEQGLWKTGGKTPAATIYAAMLREAQKKGDASRFRKASRGKFEIAS